MSGRKKLCEFGESNWPLYEDEAVCFHSPNWLGSACIHYCLTCIEKQIGNPDVLFLDPSVTAFMLHYMDMSDERERQQVVTAQEMKRRKLILVIISDTTTVSVGTGQGQHWSLIAYQQESQSALHLNSIAGSNGASARALVQVLDRMLLPEGQSSRIITLPSCPQQRGGFNCGVFALLFAQYLGKCMTEGIDVLTSDAWHAGLAIEVNEAAAEAFRIQAFDSILATKVAGV